MWTLPSCATARELTQQVHCGGCWFGKFCACVTPSPVNTYARSCLTSAFTEILKRLEQSAQPVTDDWSAAPTAQAAEWIETTTKWSYT
ncbi:hypothetical protein HPG69_014185, partial [Diceros bicornis minor]